LISHKTFSAAAIASVLGLAGYAFAQHNHHGHGAAGGHQMPADSREEVIFPPMMKAHILSNMRDHLAALQEIQAHMGNGKTDAAAKIAETRLGMSSLQNHGAYESAKFMPKGMQEIGTNMHRAASRFATAVTDSGVTNDLRPALTALSELTAQCVGCHAGYKIK
jgi:hypothetical protein